MLDKEEGPMEAHKTQQMQAGKQRLGHKIMLTTQGEGKATRREVGFPQVRPIQVLQGLLLPLRIQNLND